MMAKARMSIAPPKLGRFLWDSFLSYLMLCLAAATLFLAVAALLAGSLIVVAGLAGFWIVILGPVFAPGFYHRVRVTLSASSGMGETFADGVSLLIRLGGVGLMVWAVAVTAVQLQPTGHAFPPAQVNGEPTRNG